MHQEETMYREVNQHNKLSLVDRIRVIKLYKEQMSLRKLATEFKCSHFQISSIIKDRQKILRQYVTSRRHLLPQQSNIECDITETGIDELFENLVLEWFRRAQQHVETGPITNEMILEKAKEAKNILRIQNFPINAKWLRKFREKYEISDVDMTLLRIESNSCPLSLDMNEIGYYIAQQNPQRELLEFSVAELGDVEATDKGQSHEVVTPVIQNDEQARWYLRPLEEYAMLNENYRAIGLISQLEEIFKGFKRDEE